MNRSYLNRNLLMLKSMPLISQSLKSKASKSNPLLSKFILRTGHSGIAALCLWAALLTLAAPALAQNFTLDAAAFSPDAVQPGGTSSSNITVGAAGGFSGTVTLGCAVAPTNLTDTPACVVSPATVTPPASASATITTQGPTSTGSYSITITGTASTGTQTTPPLALTVLAVTPQFTISVQKAVAPSSVPAGNGGEGTVTINPINGYISPSTGVTLSCGTISPLVTIPPVCSFNPPTLVVTGTPISSTLTISTFGPVTTGSVAAPRSFYALWLPVPMLALVGLGVAAGGKRSRKAWGVLTLFVISGVLFLTPACGSNTGTSTTTPNGVTPNNTYTFTLMGVDSDGVVSSNTGTTSTNPTVSLTVTTAAR
jgi:hypothetical protein